MFSGYRGMYEDLRRLIEEYERERREESNEEIVEDDNAIDEEPVAVDDMIMGDFEDERWDLVSIDGGNENNDDNTALYENADITLKNFISDLMDTKLKSGISDREHELYLR
uniref:PRP1_N domain-containing protein n=1 Tax=Strongyloides venezuelensis TaxID=75913 RepID=A0A0K0FDE5_STRVS